MKKILLLSLLFFVVASSQAQTLYSFKAGAAFPKIEGGIFLGDNPLISIYPEAGASFKINNRVSFSGGLGIKTIASSITGIGSTTSGGYDAYGNPIVTSTTTTEVKDKTTLIYLSVPLYLSYIFDSRYSRNNLFLAFDFGYQPNINIYSKLGQQSTNLDLNPFVSDVIFGIRVGRTISRYQEVELGFRYCFAINDLTKKLSGWPVTANVILLTLGINIMR